MADENDTIGGYRLRRNLQTAQYTQVFEVVEPSSSRHFAMKVLLPEYAAAPEHRAMLFREAEVGTKMKHDNVVPILKVDKGMKTPHIIMEYFPAGSLRKRLMSKDPADKAYLQERAKDLIKQVATGLAYMNTSGWLHLDIKPDNVLADGTGRVKLIDFAISKPLKSGFFAKMFHKKRKPQGTMSYMSPEQIRDDLLDARADIYSFGIMCYELLTGRVPFKAGSQKELLEKQLHAKPDAPTMYNGDITDEFSKYILKMLSKNPDDRPGNFHEVLIALRDLRPLKVTARDKRD